MAAALSYLLFAGSAGARSRFPWFQRFVNDGSSAFISTSAYQAFGAQGLGDGGEVFYGFRGGQTTLESPNVLAVHFDH